MFEIYKPAGFIYRDIIGKNSFIRYISDSADILTESDTGTLVGLSTLLYSIELSIVQNFTWGYLEYSNINNDDDSSRWWEIIEWMYKNIGTFSKEWSYTQPIIIKDKSHHKGFQYSLFSLKKQEDITNFILRWV